MNINDRRAKKTRRALQEALAELLVEKELSKISIRELTEKADVHRGTFYAHYEDIFELYRNIESRVLEEIKVLLTNDYPEGFKGLKVFYELLFAYLLNNKQVSRSLFQNSSQQGIVQALSELFLEACLESWEEEYGIDSTTATAKSYAQFYLAGTVSIIVNWIEADFSTPAEELIIMFSQIDLMLGNFFQNNKQTNVE